MRRKKEKTRLAKKSGWHCGHSGNNLASWPYDDIDLCLAFDQGWAEGSAAPRDAKNPYGIFENNYVPSTGWYRKGQAKAHFFTKSGIHSKCGMTDFNESFERVASVGNTACQACLRR